MDATSPVTPSTIPPATAAPRPARVGVCGKTKGSLQCWLRAGHVPGSSHNYVEPEQCDECSGTRWPVSKHEPSCSLYGTNEGANA